MTIPRIGITNPAAAGWTQIQYPKAAYYNGKTYFGYVNGANGNVELRTYTHATGVISAATVLHAALSTPADTHNAPAIIIRNSDHKIVAAYSAHNGDSLYVWISTNAEDISAGTETDVDVPVGSGKYTYANLVQLSGESNALYLFYRNNTAGVAFWQYTKSTDGGATWATYQELYSTAGKFTYWKVANDGVSRIDFVVTDDNPANPSSKIYHFYYDGTFRKSNGTALVVSRPFTATDLTLVYDSSSGPGWMTDAIIDGNSRPRFVYSVDNGLGTDSSFCYARWTGAAWVVSTILASVGFGIVDPSPVAALDAQDTTLCYLVRKIGSHFELWRYRTPDDGLTWIGAPITYASSVDNVYPASIKDHASDFTTLWLAGTYTSDQNNSMGIYATR
jgi:hypothetical protein